jgi:anti-sigma regulatory factor (Ser/Thr protein kinase)
MCAPKGSASYAGAGKVLAHRGFALHHTPSRAKIRDSSLPDAARRIIGLAARISQHRRGGRLRGCRIGPPEPVHRTPAIRGRSGWSPTTSPAEARACVELHLSHHELGYLVDDVRLVVSELVTGAVVHASTPVRVRIEALPFWVKLTVHDGCADLPVLRPEQRFSDDAEGGRGLQVIDTCSFDWGTDVGPGNGESMLALFAMRPASSWVALAHPYAARQSVMPSPVWLAATPQVAIENAFAPEGMGASSVAGVQARGQGFKQSEPPAWTPPSGVVL